jgi:hypothetical protein
MFFTNKFVKKLWPHILKNLTKDIVFAKKNPNKEIEMTYREITR